MLSDDLFEQFDYPDPAVPSGDRNATVVAPQALLMMNSELVAQAATRLAERVLSTPGKSDPERLELAYLTAYGRPPSTIEQERAGRFLRAFQSEANQEGSPSLAEAWTTLCQSLLAANEFIYLN